LIYDLQGVPLGANKDRDQALYFNPAGSVVAGLDGIELQKGAIVRTDTYFGVFPVAAWRETCGLERLFLQVEAQGELVVRLKTLSQTAAADVVVGTWSIRSPEQSVWRSEPIALDRFADAALFIELEAEETAHVRKIGYATDLAPRRLVDLGIAITTFKREKQVCASIERLKPLVVDDPQPELGRFRLIVVDNGRDLDPSSFDHVEILPNPNLGGAGGFARGLSHCQEHTPATHCCFMDDDAATEIECLLRARRLLAYATKTDISVSAAMLRAEFPHMMHEQGALFEWARKHRIISRKHGLDLRKRAALVDVIRPEPVGYGGFWFLAFPIREQVVYPYPMFVRGDDWLFSYMNRFEIKVLPGIASWQEGFAGKIAPIEQYLAFKAFLVAELMLREPPRPLASVRFFRRWIRNHLDGFLYDRAEMNCAALEDVLKGPRFWAENVSLGERLAALKPMLSQEKPEPLTPEEMLALAPLGARKPSKKPKKSLASRILNLVSARGRILPGALLRAVGGKTRTVLGTGDAARSVDWNCARIDYVAIEGGVKFVAVRDNGRYWRLRARSFRLLLAFFMNYKKLRNDYCEFGDVCCRKEWWDAAVEAHSR